MNNPLAFWQQRNDAIDQRIRTFERKFFIVPVVIEPKPEAESKPDGMIYERRVKTKLSRPEVLRRIVKQDIPAPAPGEIENTLYPERGNK